MGARVLRCEIKGLRWGWGWGWGWVGFGWGLDGVVEVGGRMGGGGVEL